MFERIKYFALGHVTFDVEKSLILKKFSYAKIFCNSPEMDCNKSSIFISENYNA